MQLFLLLKKKPALSGRYSTFSNYLTDVKNIFGIDLNIQAVYQMSPHSLIASMELVHPLAKSIYYTYTVSSLEAS